MTLRKVDVQVDPAYAVHIGNGAARLAATRPQSWSRTFVLTDANVERLHGALVRDLPRASVHVVAPGEDSKSFATLEQVLDAMVAAGCDRGAGLVAFGGGVVGDLGGLAAALFHRGIPFIQMPTTLLAMVDSSVGGKTAVNLASGKNLAGAFHQPVEVFADTSTLATLPDDEFRSGLGEVIKTAVLDGPLLERLASDAASIARRDPDVLAGIVETCVRVKADIVRRDPREKGDRKLLNLGHTFAHAIEHVAGYGRVPHGVAVAVGVVLAAEAGRTAAMDVEPALVERLHELTRRLDVPARLSELERRYGLRCDPDALVAAMTRDKKARGGRPEFVVPLAAGAVVRDIRLPDTAVREALGNSARSS